VERFISEVAQGGGRCCRRPRCWCSGGASSAAMLVLMWHQRQKQRATRAERLRGPGTESRSAAVLLVHTTVSLCHCITALLCHNYCLAGEEQEQELIRIAVSLWWCCVTVVLLCHCGVAVQ